MALRCLGIAVHLPKKGRPAADVVILDGDWSSPQPVSTFALTSSHDDTATQLFDLASGLRSRLKGTGVDRVVVRRADRPRKASNKDGPRLRLLAEGALAAAARTEVEDVIVMPGRDLASGTPAGSKAALADEAEQRLTGQPAEAAEAALSGLVL